MVESWLSAHRGQMPEAAWQKRVSEWTPEVSARGWAGALAEHAAGNVARGVFLLAEDDVGVPVGLVSGMAAEHEPLGSTAEIGALYVVPDCRGRGVGGSLLRAASRALGELGYSALHVAVLASNLPARAFYEGMGGCEIGKRTFDEEGHLLPMTIYAWPDITALAGDSNDTPWL
jgi:ribosomal protein S18 acetylase RimI-like enzyme